MKVAWDHQPNEAFNNLDGQCKINHVEVALACMPARKATFLPQLSPFQWIGNIIGIWTISSKKLPRMP
jgi:hypothetical protein